MEVKNDHRSKFPIYAIGKKKPEKNQGFNGIRTRDLRDTGAMLYQLSYEATHWNMWNFQCVASCMSPQETRYFCPIL